jgi:glycerol-3-phosphate dehydrogenase subunit C
MYLLLRIPYRRTFPNNESSSFEKVFRKEIAPAQKNYDKRVVYFHGCFVNYNNHELGKDFVKVMNAMNYGVDIMKEKCCGVPLIANGYLEKARKNAVYNINSLQSAEEEKRIVTTSSSCAFALKYEYSSFLELDNSKIFERTDHATRFISEEFLSGNVPKMKRLGIRAAYHSPCHLERMGGVMHTLNVLKMIPGLDLVVLNSECCGIAGTYGFKTENYAISQGVGSRLFAMIDHANPEFVITDCETCKMQIEMNTNYKVLHPVTVIAMALKEK